MVLINNTEKERKLYTLHASLIIVYFLTHQGVKIRGLLLCNPNNPLGIIYSEDVLQGCLQFAAR